MALWQGKSRRKPSGGRRRYDRKKRRFEIGREQQFTRLGEQKVKRYRTRGRNSKARLMEAEFANVVDKKTGKAQRVRILTVKTNPSNPNYVQRNIITKGATLQTELGEARVISRPGQDGVINAVLVE